ncbi:MAG: lytic transglycosylase domain-containing protein [Myxococcaceae bacterium]|nr:lytic transglycosylase domain-containing protein [Myxococcaceae bacterium]
MPPAAQARGGRWLARLHVLSSGCAKLPLIAGMALVLSARIIPVLSEPVPAPVLPSAALAEPASHDAALIDAVLAKRAPDLGLTLRRQLGQAIAEEARRTGYDPLLILAIIDVESDFEEEAVSVKGARGLMQIRPSTLHFLAEKQGLRLSREEVAADPALCVRLGIRYLRTLQDRFGGDLDFALMAYNAGPTRIRKAIKEGEVEVFRRYPRLVKRDFKRFREGQGLGGDWALAQREGSEQPPGP